MTDKTDQHTQAALWLAEQLARPVDSNDECTEIHGEHEISTEFKDLGLADVVEWADQYRILTWTNIVRYGRKVSIELVDTTRIKYKLIAENMPTISLGNRSFSVVDTSNCHIHHTVLVTSVDDETEDEKILSKINVARIVGDQSSAFSGFNLEDLGLVLKAWVHLGGALEDLEGIPSYLAEE